ncbi:CDP-glycerol glycerophosphotransferase family protein [Anaeromicropila herbilytica]|uniref:Teichoic acid biosynthesis protein F n=1 Tax=Anaeromicropila herbilytica TaxID=2785025 RepID=A0A7R7EPF2_9FIRM|nr:CDP-glycerol glycerophosphotransferase family protein [Anaeromicropila herbilytica]BCN32547.1 teichoic acid biosynthesis protein F [Anaeromicropila herbilytica]
MNKLITDIKYWLQALMIPLYWFSFLTPRNKSIWLLGSSFGKSFSGNPKYLFLYLNQYQKDNVRAIWISRDKKIVDFLNNKGYEAYDAKSFYGIFYCLRAKVYIFDNYSKDISFWLSGGAKKINLWHGVGLKKINYDNIFDTVRHPKNKWERFKTYLRRMSDEKPNHYILATSKMMADIFASAFQTTDKQILTCGYPRNDIMFESDFKNIYNDTEEIALQYMKEQRKEGKYNVLYMPTFRPTEQEFFSIMDLNAFNNYLCDNNIVFYTKLHPKSKLKTQFGELQYSNIYDISADVDVYGLFHEVDVLVSDYSSVFFDYLMCDRPIILFPYDYSTFLKNTREFYFDYEEYTPGKKVYTMEELMKEILDARVVDKNIEKRHILRNKMFKHIDDRSSKRVYEQVARIVKLSKISSK